jgi:nicotinate-nucleotide adenylyltransferase
VFFLTGRDAAERILTWDYDDAAAALHQMLTSFQLIVCDREGIFRLPDSPLLAPYAHRIHRCQLPASYNAISSTEVRQRCQQGRSIDHLVPPAVAAYIQQQRLYLDDGQ